MSDFLKLLAFSSNPDTPQDRLFSNKRIGRILSIFLLHSKLVVELNVVFKIHVMSLTTSSAGQRHTILFSAQSERLGYIVPYVTLQGITKTKYGIH